MRNTAILGAAFLVALSSSSTFAQTDGGGSKSVSEYQTSSSSPLSREFVAVRPQIGFMNYDNAIGEAATRLVVGGTLDMNALRLRNPLGLSADEWFIGPSGGLFLSHLGDPGSNFLGFNAPVNLDAGGNFASLPLNLKVGYLLTPKFRVGGHIGGNLLYRSTERAMQLGAANPGTDADLSLFLNLGADLEFAATREIAFTIRPDLILTSGGDIFTGTLAVIIPLGPRGTA